MKIIKHYQETAGEKERCSPPLENGSRPEPFRRFADISSTQISEEGRRHLNVFAVISNVLPERNLALYRG